MLFPTHQEARSFLDALIDSGVECEYGKVSIGMPLCDVDKLAYRTQMTYSEEYRALEDLDSCNVYIENLPMSMTDAVGFVCFQPDLAELTLEDLDDLLAHWGKCMSPKFMLDMHGKRKGPVLARMENREQAEDVVEAVSLIL